MTDTDFRVGIDSGLEGGIAILDCRHHTWEVHSMPLNQDGTIDGHRLAMLFNDVCNSRITIEDVGNFSGIAAKRKQGNTGRQMIEFGVILGVLQTLSLDYELIAARSWQTAAKKKDLSSKEESIVKAIELYPRLQRLLLKDGSNVTYSDGKAEAVLILHYQLVQEAKLAKAKRKGGKS